MIEVEGWALRNAAGIVVVDVCPGATETGIWNIALGWPTLDEIAWQKEHGAVAYRCRVVPVET